MVVEDKSVVGRKELNGSEDTLESFQIPDGEVWYVDTAYIISDGTGDYANLIVSFGVMDSTTMDNLGQRVRDTPRGFILTLDTTTTEGDSSTFGAYAVGGQEVRLFETQALGGSSGHYEYGVIMRRIV